jgi:uncharacterized protein
MRQKLNIITLGVKNLETSLTFYEQGLGWKRSPASQGDIVFFSLGGMTLAIYPREKLAEDITINESGTGFNGITLAINAKDKNEVDTVLKEVVKLGAKLLKPAQEVFWGGYSGYFGDPDGHIFEVAYNPFVTFDENDNLIM